MCITLENIIFENIIIMNNAFSNLEYVIVLVLGSCPKLRHDNGSGLGKCLVIHTHSHKCGRMNPNTSKWFFSLNHTMF
jgi:hypothetical protein